MGTEIYYFTGTGNSLKIAKELSNKIEDSLLIPIAKVWELENFKSKNKKVGFIFPLYYSGLPKIVADFINRIDLDNSNYFFTVVTNAGGINEQPLQQLDRILKKKSKKLHAGFYITMPNNYIIGFDIHSEKQQKEFFKKAIEKIELISKTVNLGKENVTPEILQRDVTNSERFNMKFFETVNEKDKSFYSDDTCTSCGICEKICPVNNILLVDGKPKWQHRCQLCLACINFCPEKSIQFSEKSLKTQRYHHPDITIEDIINQKG
ncbi:MAG: EFR1 family ferrodoxin [Promethearchaeota archaeon]